jgi:hypothetical protein
MKDTSSTKRGYQAEVHFTLGAVIQGFTLAALGNEIADALRSLPFPGAAWAFVAGFQSLLLCIIFWYTFMDNYFFGFRVLNLRALTHFYYAALYLVLGLLQVLAIRFIDAPRTWMTCYVLLLLATLAGTRIAAKDFVDSPDKAVREAIGYDPGSREFIIASLLAFVYLLTWYALPNPEHEGFKAGGLSISGLSILFFIYYYIRRFQRHLEASGRI